MTFVRTCLLPLLALPGLLFVWLVLLLLLAGGCGGPTEVDRDNGRVSIEIQTAVTLKNPRLLEASAARAKDRHDAGLLADADYDALRQIVEKARAGSWQDAEGEAAAFRRRRPFVPPGH
ncbi:MAG TPA: hypothetical protein VMF30_12315 [Pirellulales bacterium]|nr:hypothetical protein [Pirellulales bacterium]